MEFRGSVRTRTSSLRDKAERAVVMGMRPMNSGIRPNFWKSCGSA